MKTTEDLFQQRLHTYTITHAIEDGNVLRFHVDYYKPQGKTVPKPGEPLAKRAVIEAILAKHDAATGQRRFNALLATSSINDAIEYHPLQDHAGRETGRRSRLPAAEHRLRLLAACRRRS
jgi:type I restriction enzyme, R subunit